MKNALAAAMELEEGMANPLVNPAIANPLRGFRDKMVAQFAEQRTGLRAPARTGTHPRGIVYMPKSRERRARDRELRRARKERLRARRRFLRNR